MWEKSERTVRKNEKWEKKQDVWEKVRKVWEKIRCVRKKWEMWEREVWANVSMRKKFNKLFSYKDADLFKNFD